MDIAAVVDVFQQALMVALKVSAPILIVSMGAGLIISIFQAATQIHEQTLTFVPKLILIGLVLLVLGSWMSETLLEFFEMIFKSIADLK